MDSTTVRLQIHVKPMKNETKIFKEADGTLIMDVVSPPVKGKANREIVKWLKKQLRLPSSNVQLIGGFHSNVKVVQITGMTEAEINATLKIKARVEQ